MNHQPINDRIIVKPILQESTTGGGIFIPDSAKERPFRGTVVAVGPGRILDSGERGEMVTREGDRIIYNKYSGAQFEIDGDDYVIMREDEALAVEKKS